MSPELLGICELFLDYSVELKFPLAVVLTLVPLDILFISQIVCILFRLNLVRNRARAGVRFELLHLPPFRA